MQVLRVAVDNTGASEVELSAAMQQTEGSRSFSVECASPPRPLDELGPVCSLRRVSRLQETSSETRCEVSLAYELVRD